MKFAYFLKRKWRYGEDFKQIEKKEANEQTAINEKLEDSDIITFFRIPEAIAIELTLKDCEKHPKCDYIEAF